MSHPSRRLTVTAQHRTRHDRYGRFAGESSHAALLLAGRWLEAAGFTAGDRVDVHVEAGRLVITQPSPAPGQPTRAEVEAVRAVILGTRS